MTTTGIAVLRPAELFHGRYRVVRCIKAGGMGAVYEVLDERTNGPRALKVMLPNVLADADLRARFALEAKVTGAIASDHIVRVSDAAIDEATDTPFLVMDLLQGQELAGLLEKRGPLPAAEVVLYLHQTALALDKTHAAGIVHRDLKPENLFVTVRDDGSACVKILDFGIAKVVAESSSRTTRAVGTPMFMAPEQLAGDATIGPRTDLFALAHIAYALLAGEPYWDEEQRSSESLYPLLSRIMLGMREAPTARALRRRGVALPASFDAWMAQAAAPKQEARFARASEMVAALCDVLGVASPRGTPTSLDASLAPGRPSDAPSVPPAYGSGPQRGATGVAVLSTPVIPKSRSALPLVVGFLALALAGAGAFAALRTAPAPAVPASASAPVEVASASAAVAPQLASTGDAPSVSPASPAPAPTAAPTAAPAASVTKPASAARANDKPAAPSAPPRTTPKPAGVYDPSKEM